MKKILTVFVAALFAVGLIFAQEAEAVTAGESAAPAEEQDATPAHASDTQPAETDTATAASKTAASADNADAANKVALEYAEYLFADGFVKQNNAKKIERLSPLLTPTQREALYEEHEQFGVKPFLLNLLIGFGIGSFSQGDRAIGHLQLWGDIVGYGMIISGMIMTSSASADDTNGMLAGSAVSTIGSLVTLAVAIPACIRAWTFAADTNKAMRRVLNVDENGKAVASESGAATVSFAPIVQPVTGKYGLMARIAF